MSLPASTPVHSSSSGSPSADPTASPIADRPSTDVVSTAPAPARGEVLQRNLAVLATAGLIVLQIVSVLVEPDLPDDKRVLLSTIEAHHTRAVIGLVCFILAQIASVGAVLGVARLARERSPRLGVLGALVTTLGAFGHAVYGGLTLGIVVMAADVAHRETYLALLGPIDGLPFIGLFALLGLAGVVVGTLLISLAVFRGRIGPRWVAPLLWAFLLVEFVGSSVVDQLGYLSPFLAAAAWIMIIRELRRHW